VGAKASHLEIGSLRERKGKKKGKILTINKKKGKLAVSRAQDVRKKKEENRSRTNTR